MTDTLLSLQNRIKRDPESYREDFLLQYRHYASQLEIFKLDAGSENKEFCDLVSFLGHVTTSYPKDMKDFAPGLIELLEENFTIMTQAVRASIVKTLILLRNRDQLQPLEYVDRHGHALARRHAARAVVCESRARGAARRPLALLDTKVGHRTAGNAAHARTRAPPRRPATESFRSSSASSAARTRRCARSSTRTL